MLRRRFVYLHDRLFVLLVLSQLKKIRSNGALPQAGSAMAVANDNDLQLIEPVVGPSQNTLYPN